jgi:hypothetical protein
MRNLEYQFEIEVRKGTKQEKIVIPTERMPYETASDLSDKLNRTGIHYRIIEITTECNNRRCITSRMLRMPIRKKWSEY